MITALVIMVITLLLCYVIPEMKCEKCHLSSQQNAWITEDWASIE